MPRKTKQNPKKHIEKWLQQACTELDLKIEDDVIQLEKPGESSHGDFATSAALKLFGTVRSSEHGSDTISEHTSDSGASSQGAEAPRKYTSPRDLAEKIVERIMQNPKYDPDLADVSVAGPGFINFTLSDTFLRNHFTQASDISQELSGQRVIVEFTDPNPFKEFHIGHLYSNIVGESIARLHEAQGAEVHRVCYQGDVGMHVAKSVWGLQRKLAEFYPEDSILEALEKVSREPVSARIKLLGQSYALGATAYKDDESAQSEIKQINFMTYQSAQENLIEQDGWQPQVDYSQHLNLESDKTLYQQIKQLYQAGRSWSLEYFNQMYARAGMQFDDFFFESLVGEYGLKIVKEHLGDVFTESQGAIIFAGSEHGLHDRVFVNSLGLPTYEAKELGLAPEKYRRWPYDTSIIITGNEIDEYFKVLLTAMNLTHPDLAAKTTHLSHGMVRLPEGKMSSRTGKIVTGEWLMTEAHDRVLAHLHENRPEMDDQTAAQIAETVALGAIKYAFLKSSIGRDISFSFDESLSFSGNSGPYLQYTAVRCKSVLAKTGKNQTMPGNKQTDQATLHPEERTVLRLLVLFDDAVSQARQEHAPHVLSQYLYQLAQAFSSLYDRHTIQGNCLRTLITESALAVLEQGLWILGISVSEKM